MPIERYYGKAETALVTLGEKQLHFAASLVGERGLGKFNYVQIGVDPELRRIYFAFFEKPTPGSSKFFKQSNRSMRRMIAVGGLYAKYAWFDALRRRKEKGKRQFVLEEVTPDETDAYPTYQYFIAVGD